MYESRENYMKVQDASNKKNVHSSTSHYSPEGKNTVSYRELWYDGIY